jgi:hypothetical protein
MANRIKERDGGKTPIILPGSADRICPDGDILGSIRNSGGRRTIHTGKPYGEVDSGEETQNIKEEQEDIREEPEKNMGQTSESQIPESLKERKKVVSKRISKYLAVLKMNEEEIDTSRCGCGGRRYATRAKPSCTPTEPIVVEDNLGKETEEGENILQGSIRNSGGRVTIHTGKPYGEIDSGEETQDIKKEKEMVREEPESNMGQVPESQIPESLKEKKRIVSKRTSRYLAVLKMDEEEIDTSRCGCGSRKYSTRAKPSGTLTEPIMVEDNREKGTEEEEENVLRGSSQSLRNSIKRASTGVVGGVIVNLIGERNTLTDSVLFKDGEKTVHSFVENVYKCKGDFYSLNPISEWKNPGS